jgi:DNA-binding LacI/PurR family transcriptional regulator
MNNVTLKKIAELSGVSIRTVSRALKNQPGVNPDLCTRILELAEHLGYTPNIAARNLRLQRSNCVGIISTFTDNHVATRKVNNLQKQLEEHGFFSLLGLLPPSPADLRSILQEWAGMANTVVFLSWHHQLKPSEVLQGLPQQFIFVDIADFSGYHSLSIERGNGIREGISHLLRRGRRRIARCGSIASRAHGFNLAFQDFKEAAAEHFYFQTPDSSFEDGQSIAPQLLANNIDAVFFDTDRMAYGFLKYCWNNHIRIPEQISVIGFDDDPWSGYACPALSTVAHPLIEVNKHIVKLAIEEAPPARMEFSTRFINRESV